MSKSQNTKNEQQKDLCITSEQLTEQWKKGELQSGWYWVELKEGTFVDGKKSIILDYLFEFTNDFERHPYLVEQVLAPVPSYEVYKELIDGRKLIREYIKDITNENAQLKEQINKCCLDAINSGTANAVKAVKEFGMPERIEELVKQNRQLKELLKKILDKTKTCYSMVFQKDIINAELNKVLLKKIDEVLQCGNIK